MDVDFEWNKSSAKIILDKGFTRSFYKDVGNIFLDYMFPYIPWDSKNENRHMAELIAVRPNPSSNSASIIFTKNYAKYQKNADDSNWNRDRSVHPLATSNWDYWAWTEHQSEILNDIDKARKRHCRKDYNE